MSVWGLKLPLRGAGTITFSRGRTSQTATLAGHLKWGAGRPCRSPSTLLGRFAMPALWEITAGRGSTSASSCRRWAGSLEPPTAFTGHPGGCAFYLPHVPLVFNKSFQTYLSLHRESSGLLWAPCLELEELNPRGTRHKSSQDQDTRPLLRVMHPPHTLRMEL
jgi:hypothetical protein